MAKAICICRRNRAAYPDLTRKVERLNRMLTPDHILPKPPFIIDIGGVTTAILNPNGEAPQHVASACLGVLIRPQDDWWRPRAAVPDGTYALFRCDESAVELLNDVVGSRTIWYIQTDDIFIASTSQRAIVSLLGSFDPGDDVIPWMFSAGHLGPDNSYDRRIRPMRPNSRVLLDRTSWRLSVEEMGNEIVPADEPLDVHSAGLQTAIENAFAHLELDSERWVLPLSGGVDSRAILYWIKDREHLRAVTWGVRAALEDKGNDAYIAGLVARHYRLDHRYFETDVSKEPLATLLDRYLVAGEGRVDEIAGYTDGFKIWKALFDEGTAGVLRGDECFGMRMPVFTAFGVRRYVNCLVLSDYANLPPSLVAELPPQPFPERLARRGGEPILRWRDRLYYNYRMPCVMAALNDLKCSYVDVVNPFLARSIVDYMRTVPDALRLGRKPFMAIVEKLSPDIPYAERAAIDTSFDFFRSKAVVEMIADELGSARAESVFPRSLIDYLRAHMRTHAAEGPARAEHHAKYIVPARIRKSLAKATRQPRGLLRDRFKKPVLDPNLMAFRAFIVSRMRTLLEEDARAFHKGLEP